MKTALLRSLGLILAAPCAFFTYYTVRLVYITLAVHGAATHRHSGMYIGAFAFPLAAAIFGGLSLRCFETARRTRAGSPMLNSWPENPGF